MAKKRRFEGIVDEEFPEFPCFPEIPVNSREFPIKRKCNAYFFINCLFNSKQTYIIIDAISLEKVGCDLLKKHRNNIEFGIKIERTGKA